MPERPITPPNTSMTSTQFKLVQTGPGALTRRVTFAEQPSWFSLATRIESLYGIPIQDVGVSYVDSDGDEITLSTHEELQDFYSTVPRVHSAAIKFTVKNLGAFRRQQSQRTAPRNLFDDEDWQVPHIPGFPGIAVFEQADNNGSPPPPPPKSPSSAFVETVDSSSATEPAVAVTDIRSGTVSPQAVIVDMDNKGKGRDELLPPVQELEDDGSSVVSLASSSEPVKEPVHVYEFDSEDGYDDAPFRHSARPRSRSIQHSPRSSRSPHRSKSVSPHRRFSAPLRSRSVTPPFRPSSVDPSFLSRADTQALHSRQSRSRSRSRSPLETFHPHFGQFGPRSRSPSLTRPTVMPRSRSHSLTPPMVRPRPPGMVIIGPRGSGRYGLRSPSRSITPPPVVRIRSPTLSDPPIPMLESVSDPPVPVPGSATASNATTSPSLTNDIAGLLNSLSSAFSAHPELSEGLRNIVRNANQGAYWSAERDTIVNEAWRVAETARDEAARAAQQAQEEAGRKVAEALGGIFRALGGLAVSASPGGSRAQQSDATLTPEQPRPENRDTIPPSNAFEAASLPNRFSERNVPLRFPPPTGPPPVHPRQSRSRSFSPPPLPPPPPPLRRSRSPGPERFHQGPPPPPPPPPPPGRHGSGWTPPSGPSPLLGHHHHHAPPHPGRYFGPYPPPMFPPMPWEPPFHGLRRSSTLPGRFGAGRFGPGLRHGPSPPPPPPPPPPADGHVSSAVRKAQLEEAKRYYKAKKEEWRREKAQRRLEKERRERERMNGMKNRDRSQLPLRQAVVYSSEEEPTGPILPPNLPTTTEWNRGEVPDQLPTGLTRLARTHNSPRIESVNRDLQRQKLMKRLADMGFTPRTYPQLESLIAKHSRKNMESPGKQSEDAIIDRLLEDLFVTPVVGESSGSRMAERPSIPGAWNM